MDFAKDLRYYGTSLVLMERSLTILQAYQDYSSAAVVAVGIAVHTEEDNLAEDSPAPAEDILPEVEEDILVEDKVAPDIPSADTRPSVG